MTIKSNQIFLLFAGLAMLLIPAAVLVIGFYAPVEAQLGIVQKIFYFHVPSAFMMYAGFGIAFVGSIAYLFKKDPKWDERAAAGASVGLLFASLVLLSGPLWAYKSWGTWWTWDPQLTATFMIYLMFWSYTAVRAFAAEGERRRVISAIIAVLAAPNMAFIHWAVTQTHPKVMRAGGGGLSASMWYTFFFCFFAFITLFIALYWMRLRLEQGKNFMARLRERSFLLEDSAPLSASPALLPLFLLMQAPGKVEEFIPASGPTESVPGGTLLVVAYAGMWALMLIYVVVLWRRHTGIARELKSVEKQLEALDRKE